MTDVSEISLDSRSAWAHDGGREYSIGLLRNNLINPGRVGFSYRFRLGIHTPACPGLRGRTKDTTITEAAR